MRGGSFFSVGTTFRKNFSIYFFSVKLDYLCENEI